MTKTRRPLSGPGPPRVPRYHVVIVLVDGRSSRFPRRGLRRTVPELVGLVAGVVLFSWLHHLAGSDISRASANAHALQAVERSLGLNVELSANNWLADSAVLSHVAVLYYRLYYLPLAAVLLWVLFRHPRAYRRVRVILIVMAAVALLVFWLLPMSPPRFALPGIADVVAENDVFGGPASRDLSNGQNHFSAFPSLHVGWSALGAYAAWLVVRGTYMRAAILFWLFPAVMIAVVITTGNHYILDVVGSAALLTASIAAAVAWERLRPNQVQVPHTP